jgi:diguanylate cyclase (GGDEF)-like protein
VQFAIDTGAQLYLMLVDLNDLSSVNEQYGRQAGDAVLIAVAERLRQSVRPRDLVARLDGDVFAVPFEGIGPADVDAIAKRMMRTVDESVSTRATRCGYR